MTNYRTLYIFYLPSISMEKESKLSTEEEITKTLYKTRVAILGLNWMIKSYEILKNTDPGVIQMLGLEKSLKEGINLNFMKLSKVAFLLGYDLQTTNEEIRETDDTFTKAWKSLAKKGAELNESGNSPRQFSDVLETQNIVQITLENKLKEKHPSS